ncbi:hypothetical protein [Mycobacterium botniense]|uniref:Uncharacterized protein n=1 Tax=Mycobacterium botniense TaxID=84962 RepID=A0A7I9Y149_9MYCO|nr:hypothetical protein [Mycobacterium botniense]GFG75776.1 hypothetical protein MBOT_31410 [Mycobacterium botniense]
MSFSTIPQMVSAAASSVRNLEPALQNAPSAGLDAWEESVAANTVAAL